MQRRIRTTKARSKGSLPTGIYKILLSQGLLWVQDSVICSAVWALLHLYCPISLVLIFVSKGNLCSQLAMEIYKKSSDVWEKKPWNPRKGRFRGELWRGFCGEIGYLQQIWRFPQECTGSQPRALELFLFIGTFLFPLTLYKKQFPYTCANKVTVSKGLWRTVFPLLVWSEILDDTLHLSIVCNLGFTLWRPT